jgi:Predicted membrane protein
MVGVAPATFAAASIELTTPYPAVAVAPGAKVTFELSIKTASPARVNLSLGKIPTDWTATLRGGGFVVDGVQTNGTDAATVTLDVAVPADASAGTQRLTVTASSGGTSTPLDLDIRVTPSAAGEVTLTTDFPQLKGVSTTNFSFNLTLANDTPDDLTFGAVAGGPAGWTVTAQVTSQAQAASTVVKAGSSTSIGVTVKAPQDATAGTYPITVDATSGDKTAHADLSIEITGSYSLTLSTPDGRLNASASAGGTTDLSVVVSNTGTADVQGVALSAAAPTGWTVTFDPATVTVPANGNIQATAHLKPSADAIAGDYVATFRATSTAASATADIRVTVETSLLWGAVGIALIALVVIGLWWTFHRYGRR